MKLIEKAINVTGTIGIIGMIFCAIACILIIVKNSMK